MDLYKVDIKIEKFFQVSYQVVYKHNYFSLCTEIRGITVKHRIMKMKVLTGNINVISSPSGFKRSEIRCAHADLMSGSMAQKNLHIQSECDNKNVFLMG